MCLPFLNLSVRYDALLRGWCVAYVGDASEQFSSYLTGTQYRLIIGTNRLMVFREIKTVYSENSMNRIKTLCARNVEFFNIKIGGTYNTRYAL
jgi:hypothetical protein